MSGLFDLQVNGWGGVDFSSPTLEPEALRSACRAIRASGTERFLVTLVTSGLAVYRRNLPLIAALIDAGEPGPVGIHLEGPFFRADSPALGVHPPEECRAADPALLAEFAALAGGHLRLLTIAADLDRAPALCAAASADGITVSLGHHLADAAQLAACAEAGARALTHLGNGLPHLIDRHHNPIWAALAETRLSAMLIADGHHLPPAMLRALLAALGPERVVLVSDCAPIAGLPPGRHRWLGRELELTPEGRLGDPVSGYLSGSAAALGDCLAHLERLGVDQVQARRWASEAPAALLAPQAAPAPERLVGS